jgi:hypothetical protein
LSRNKAKMTAATGYSFFDMGCTPIFHLMKLMSKT